MGPDWRQWMRYLVVGCLATALFSCAAAAQGMSVRIAGPDRSVEVSQGGDVVRIRKADRSFRFTREADGSIEVQISKGKEAEIRRFGSMQKLRESDKELHAELQASQLKAHGQAAAADPAQDRGMGDGNLRGSGDEAFAFLDALEGVVFADGDLTDEERANLNSRAREKLEAEMLKLLERERRNARGEGAEDAQVSLDIRRSRYRASLSALERDLIYRTGELRVPGGERFASTLDEQDDRVREFFAKLHDRVDDGLPEAWPQALEDGRKFHAGHSADLAKWAKEIGVTAKVMDIPRRITEMKKQLRNRLRRIRKQTRDPIESQLDDLEEMLLESYENLEDKVRDTPPAAWNELLADAEKYFVQYSKDLDRWAREAGIKESVPSPLESIESLRADLLDRVEQLRRLAGDKHEKELDELRDGINDTYATLKERVLNQDKKNWDELRGEAERHYEIYAASIQVWQRRIELGSAPERSPDQDVKLEPGEHMDIIEGVRVARLMPLPRQQLGLDNGLSVNEVVDADKGLPRAGVQVYDIILEINGTPVDSRTDLRKAVKAVESGAEYTVKVLRKGERKELKATR